MSGGPTKILAEEASAEALLRHDDELVRQLGELLIHIEPILEVWVRNMMERGVKLSAILDNSVNAGVSIGHTLMSLAVEDDDFDGATMQWCQHMREAIEMIAAKTKQGGN